MTRIIIALAATAVVAVVVVFLIGPSDPQPETATQSVQKAETASAPTSAPAPTPAPTPTPEPAAAPQSFTDMLASADLADGRKETRKCVGCHSMIKDAKSKVGPNLWGVVGAKVANVADYRFSDAMVAYGGTWTPERLSAFLEKPRKEVDGTRMSFAGIRDAAKRANLIAYLNSQSDTPVDLAKASQ